jgi:dTDP-4-dehydrorhamnose reductase
LGTGCIFDGYEGYTENDIPNFFGSQYSTMKGFTDRLMHFFDDTALNVRIRMPCSNTVNKRNYITKLMTYEKICSIPNSVTVLPQLLPYMIDMAKKRQTGTINLTNPGLISHNEILEMVREIIDLNFTWTNFTIDEQSEVLLGGRSNNLLDTAKLQFLYPDVLNAKEAIRKCILELKENM